MDPSRWIPGAAGRVSYWAAIQWQPKIDLTADTHIHDEFNGSNLFPIVLLNPPTAPPPGGGGVPVRLLMGLGT